MSAGPARTAGACRRTARPSRSSDGRPRSPRRSAPRPAPRPRRPAAAAAPRPWPLPPRPSRPPSSPPCPPCPRPRRPCPCPCSSPPGGARPHSERPAASGYATAAQGRSTHGVRRVLRARAPQAARGRRARLGDAEADVARERQRRVLRQRGGPEHVHARKVRRHGQAAVALGQRGPGARALRRRPLGRLAAVPRRRARPARPCRVSSP